MPATSSERGVARLQNKLNAYFQHINSIYDRIAKLDCDNKSQFESFLALASTIDKIRESFLSALEERNELVVASNDEAPVPNYNDLMAFEELYSHIKFKYNQLSARAAPCSSDNSDNKPTTCRQVPKLPPLELCSFNGDLQNWPTFYESFRTVIHDNDQLTDSEKMYYLIGRLTGKAQLLANGFIPTGDNYILLWNALINKYNDKRLLGASLIDKLLNIPAVRESNPVQLEQFIDEYSSIISSLKQLKISNLEDFIFIHIGCKKVDLETVKQFEINSKHENKLPTYLDFIAFIRDQSQILQRAYNKCSSAPAPAPRKVTMSPAVSAKSRVQIRSIAPQPRVSKTFVNVTNTQTKCLMCNMNHAQLYLCPQFLSKTSHERYTFAKLNKLCINCLSNKHTLKMCKSQSKCRSCGRGHHSLLHFDTNTHITATAPAPALTTAPSPAPAPATASVCNTACADNQPLSLCAVGAPACSRTSTVLLGTALCHVVDNKGNLHTVRVLMDSASQRDLITIDCLNRLNLKLYPSRNNCVTGVGDVTNPIEGTTCLTIRSRIDDSIRFTLQPFVVNRITNELPTTQIDIAQLNYLCNIPLADYDYHKPAPIDMILGSDLFARVLLSNKVSRAPNEPVAIETALGYLIVGEAPAVDSTTLASAPALFASAPSAPAPSATAPFPVVNIVRTFCSINDFSLEKSLNKFFELEDVPEASTLTPEEQECETIYRDTTSRDENGRFVVVLPFKSDESMLGDSLQSALRRYNSLERRFVMNPSIKAEYDDIFREYLQKGYLTLVGNYTEPRSELQYVIPHHPVVRLDKSTSKVRVVLDASMKTTSGQSLNDLLHTGPNLQNDLFKIILNVRLFPIAICADIRQMYLRILVNVNDRRFIRILYRFHENEPLKLYEFTRVPFGLRSSPYLALRTVRELAENESDRFPIAAPVAKRDIYMDDVATSCISAAEGVELSNQLIGLFHAGGFELVKFSSNSAEVMAGVPVSHRVSEAVEFSPDKNLKLLGLQWLPVEDAFTFSVYQEHRECTKRNILSTIARLWDLMGFVAPVTLLAKLIIKQLWLNKVDWDDQPPLDIISLWRQFESELPSLQNIRIPRHVGANNNCIVSILGFADASESAYGGVIYVHVLQPTSNWYKISLVCAKSRVAPLRNVSLPRLELCGALILAKLLRIVIDTYSSRCQINNVFAFSDSTVALAWIHSPPGRWQTFVANRVAKIHNAIDPQKFHHIPGKDNPADCLSRGLTPAQLIDHPLWFNGPRFAHSHISNWPVHNQFDPTTVDDIPEMKISNTYASVTSIEEPPLLYTLASKVSSWSKLVKIVIYVYRFIRKLSIKFKISHIDFAELAIIKDLQTVHFSRELNNIQSGKQLSPALRKLNVFLHDGVIRVGGRLSNADISYDSQHPILLPRKDHIVNLIIDHYHQKYLHTGPQLLMSLLRQKYWILSARNIVRKRTQSCNVCFRSKPRNEFPIMADLPACRVQEAKAFVHSGVDYAGPLSIIPYRRRGVHSQKAYICLFVCLVTKAVHIELASDLSTESFLHALKRFISRRGPISCIYSDCGTNFIGAKSYLDNIYKLISSEEYNNKFESELRTHRIEWKFNPPASPHFGGIWEGNVRSMKMHLNKIVSNHLLTFEEMITVLTQIEAILNSRPLSVLSSDPTEPLALTPAHFLTLTPLKSLPAEDLTSDNINLLQRKRIVDHMVQSFWKRWKIEYLHTLQSRQKWTKHSKPIQIGTVVLLKADNSSPLSWPLGIVEEVFPGPDGVIRVVNIRTKSGLYRRPIVKICPLPTQ